MKKYYLEVRIREVDTRITPDRNSVEWLEMRDSHVWCVQLTSMAVTKAAFGAAVQMAKEVTGQ